MKYMENQELKIFIQKSLAEGRSKQEIFDVLMQVGWKKEDVELYFRENSKNIFTRRLTFKSFFLFWFKRPDLAFSFLFLTWLIFFILFQLAWMAPGGPGMGLVLFIPPLEAIGIFEIFIFVSGVAGVIRLVRQRRKLGAIFSSRVSQSTIAIILLVVYLSSATIYFKFMDEGRMRFYPPSPLMFTMNRLWDEIYPNIIFIGRGPRGKVFDGLIFVREGHVKFINGAARDSFEVYKYKENGDKVILNLLEPSTMDRDYFFINFIPSSDSFIYSMAVDEEDGFEEIRIFDGTVKKIPKYKPRLEYYLQNIGAPRKEKLLSPSEYNKLREKIDVGYKTTSLSFDHFNGDLGNISVDGITYSLFLEFSGDGSNPDYHIRKVNIATKEIVARIPISNLSDKEGFSDIYGARIINNNSLIIGANLNDLFLVTLNPFSIKPIVISGVNKNKISWWGAFSGNNPAIDQEGNLVFLVTVLLGRSRGGTYLHIVNLYDSAIKKEFRIKDSIGGVYWVAHKNY